jgi:hypothetical protein
MINVKFELSKSLDYGESAVVIYQQVTARNESDTVRVVELR